MYTDANDVTESGSNTTFSGQVPVDPYYGGFSPGKAIATGFWGGAGSETLVLSVNTSGVIEYDLYNGTSWGSFAPVNSAASFTAGEQIAVAPNSTDTFTLYAATSTGGIDTAYYNGTSWGSYSALASAGAVADGAAVTEVLGSTTSMLAAISSTGVIKYDLYNGSSWGGIATVNSAASFVAGKPVGLTELITSNYFALYATTSTGAIDGITFNGSTWTSGYNTLASAGTFADGGAVTVKLVNVSTGALNLFAIAKTGKMEEDVNSGSGWSGFTALGSQSDFTPGASVGAFTFGWVPYSSFDVYLFTDATNGEQNANYYNFFNTTWSGWFALGGGVVS
jgi:hypothetical protein